MAGRRTRARCDVLRKSALSVPQSACRWQQKRSFMMSARNLRHTKTFLRPHFDRRHSAPL